MTQEELRRIALIQLEIMDAVHQLCVEENILYYIIGGTLLGAVRHKGFIPWDLDIDIAMPRDHYERFKNVCKTRLDSKYEYLDYTKCSSYPRPHALVVRKNTKVKTKYDSINPSIMDLGIYIDVFPLDAAPDDIRLRNKQAKRLMNIRKFKAHRMPYSYSYKKWKRTIHYILSGLLSVIPVRTINQVQQNQMMKYQGQTTECICSMASRYPYTKQCMNRQIYGKPTLLVFEGREYYAPEKYHAYLTQLYGDYMQLPPLEKRQANLEFFTSVDFPEEDATKE